MLRSIELCRQMFLTLSVKQCSGIAAGFKSDGVRGHAIKQFAKRHAERDVQVETFQNLRQMPLLPLFLQSQFSMPCMF